MPQPSPARRYAVRHRRGLGLLEAALFLGITGLVLGGIWAAVSSVSSNKQIDTTVGQIIQIAQNMRALYSNQSAFSGGSGFSTGSDITEKMGKLDIAPVEMIDQTDASVWRSVWKSPVHVYVGPTLITFRVRYTSITKESCLATIARSIGPGRDRGLDRVVIDGTTYSGTGLENLKITDIGTACNAVDFIFKLKG